MLASLSLFTPCDLFPDPRNNGSFSNFSSIKVEIVESKIDLSSFIPFDIANQGPEITGSDIQSTLQCPLNHLEYTSEILDSLSIAFAMANPCIHANLGDLKRHRFACGGL